MNRKMISYGLKINPKVINVGCCLAARGCFSNYNPENAVLESGGVQ